MKLRIVLSVREGTPVYDFNQCREIAVVEVVDGNITQSLTTGFDPNDPDAVARSLEAMDIDIVIAGGMSHDILARLNKTRMNVVTGATGASVEEVVTAFLDGTLVKEASAMPPEQHTVA